MTGPVLFRTLSAARRAEKDMTYLWTSLSALGAVVLDRHHRKDHRPVIDENALLERVPGEAPARIDVRVPRIAVVKPARAKVA
jgi:hypothetical protein